MFSHGTNKACFAIGPFKVLTTGRPSRRRQTNGALCSRTGRVVSLAGNERSKLKAAVDKLFLLSEKRRQGMFVTTSVKDT